MLKDKRHILYYLFTSGVVATFLAIEDFFDVDSPGLLTILIELLFDIPKLFLVCIVMSFLSSWIIKKLDNRFPWKEALLKRFIIEVSTILGLVAFLTLSTSFIINYFDLQGVKPDDDGDFDFELLTSIMSFITLFMLFTFHEIMGISNENIALSARAKNLEQENYITRFEVLKHQINPHFLFNSLNVLSSLIYKDTKLADRFIAKFSDVFRYIVELNQEQLVPLKKELKVLESYVFLQKIRYGESLLVNQKIDARMLDYLIPPMTLQITIENSIKHNIISRESQLQIDIFGDSDVLRINNSYQPREIAEGSTQIGQSNLRQRYKLLNMPVPEFYVENGQYSAILPLLKEQHASTDS
ncbi:MAG: histidine kinase [Roseivirga sp.]|nr:histidine kinase [Roseivirga sp.]